MKKLSDKAKDWIASIVEWTYAVLLILMILTDLILGNNNSVFDKSCLLVWLGIEMLYRRLCNRKTEALKETNKFADFAFEKFKDMMRDCVYLLIRVDGLSGAVHRAAVARKADREKLRRIVEVANAIDANMTDNDSFNRQKIEWASAIRSIAYGRTDNA